jgi:hypothetical protein
MYLGYASSRSTWYPNVTLFTLFDELEVLSLGSMQIGGGLQRTWQLLLPDHFFFLFSFLIP